jgi:long-chain acyl-CoA synthetase
MTLFDEFKRNRDERPDSPAFLIAAGDRSVPITWREFARDVEAIAWMAGHFVPGATVGLLGENSYEWITAHAAGVFGGITVVPLEMTLSPAEIAERLAFVGAKVLVHSALYVEKAQEVERLLPGLIVAGFGSHKADEYMELARTALDAGDPGVFDGPQPDEDKTCAIVFTSGTTSKPRGAELTLRGMRTFSEFASEQLPQTPGERSLMLLPLHHIFGICTTYMMLANGVALGVCPDFRRIYDAVARFRANYIFLVPALAEILAAKIAQHGRSAEEALGSPIDWILVGGAPLSRRTYEHLQELGIRPLTGYGLTETTSLYSIAPVGDPRPGSAGMACGGHGGMETKTGPNGELLIRGPAVLKGYFKEPERTADVLDAEGWFNTGDIGRIDDDGYVWITGRASRTIVLSSGKKVAPEELEEKLLCIPGIHEAVVSGDGATRELQAEVYAVVSEETVRRQIDMLNRQLPVHKRIKIVKVREDPFPRTASGKIKVESTCAPSGKVAIVSTGETDAKPETGNPKLEIRNSKPETRNSKLETRNLPIAFTGEVAVFIKAYMLPLMIAAIAVMALNVLKLVLRNIGVELPASLKVFEEIGELALAVLVILVVLGVRHRRRKAFQRR